MKFSTSGEAPDATLDDAPRWSLHQRRVGTMERPEPRLSQGKLPPDNAA